MIKWQKFRKPYIAISTDRRFTILRDKNGYYVLDLDTYNDSIQPTLKKAKEWANSWV